MLGIITALLILIDTLSVKYSNSFMIGGVFTLDTSELEEDLRQARNLFEEENTRSRGPTGGHEPRQGPTNSSLSEDDISVLKRKHPFLAEFSDNFIRCTPIGDLMKIQSTAMKAGEIEKAKDADDRLAVNKASLASTFTLVNTIIFLLK
jgi:hypothetical protein